MIHFANVLRSLKASPAPLSLLRDNPPPFSASESMLATAYPASELSEFDTTQANPPSLPTGWPPAHSAIALATRLRIWGNHRSERPVCSTGSCPDYTVPGLLAQAGLFAPELQISTESSEVARINVPLERDVGESGGHEHPAGRGRQRVRLYPERCFCDTGSEVLVGDADLHGCQLECAAERHRHGQQQWRSIRTPDWQCAVHTWRHDVHLQRGQRAAADHRGAGQRIEKRRPAHRANRRQHLGARRRQDGYLQCDADSASNVRCDGDDVRGLQVSLSSNTLTFTAGNWNVEQTVTVAAVNDATTEAAGATDTIAFTTSSTAANYNGLTAPSITANVVDNDDGARAAMAC